jgi:NAD(P)-dependent dehydrogenase (short-subunit alcohol dehydrogenase family)
VGRSCKAERVIDDLRGRVALVTGASGGIGGGLARALGAAGCDVAVGFSGSAGSAEETAEAVRAAGARSTAFPADLADPEATTRLVAEVESEPARSTYSSRTPGSPTACGRSTRSISACGSALWRST